MRTHIVGWNLYSKGNTWNRDYTEKGEGSYIEWGDIWERRTYWGGDIYGKGTTRNGNYTEKGEGTYTDKGDARKMDTHGEGENYREGTHLEWGHKRRGDIHGEQITRAGIKLRFLRGDPLRRKDTRGTHKGDIHGKRTIWNVNYTEKEEGTHTVRGHRRSMDPQRGDTHVVGTYTERKEEI